MAQYPAWLPPIVAKYADDVVQGELTLEQRGRLNRIVSSPEMERVWRTLAKLSDPQGLRDYAREVVFELSRRSVESAPLGPSPAEERQILRRIAVLLERLLKELGRLSGDLTNPSTGVSRVLAALLRAACAAVPQGKAKELAQAMQLWRRFQGQDNSLKIAQMLDDLRQAVQIAQDVPAHSGPRKRYAKNAARTEYIQMLVARTRSACGKPLYAEVATTVNVAFAEFDNPVTPDHIRKLATSAQKITDPKA